MKRYAAIWFRHLEADWVARRRPALRDKPFVLATPARGRMVVTSASRAATDMGIYKGMAVADCRAVMPALEVLPDVPGQTQKLLTAIAEWLIRYTPVAATDMPDGVLLDISGCSHLWGGEEPYLRDILSKLRGYGYHVRAAIASTIGTAWAVARHGQQACIIEPGGQGQALLPLPPVALRIDEVMAAKLSRLGLQHVRDIITISRSALKRRFGAELLMRIDQALGQQPEALQPVCPIEPWQERLPCLEPIRTATGIEIALRQLLDALCARLAKEEKGLRHCLLKACRVDGKTQQVQIGTNKPSRNVQHLYKLLEQKTGALAPALGFELFVLEAHIVEDMPATQDALWNVAAHDDAKVAELLDRISGKVGAGAVHRYLPAAHYWPERSYKEAENLDEPANTVWRDNIPRPLHLLARPEVISVSVPMPDYPPMLFIHNGTLHNVKRADGPERIEQEWWIETGLYRDYYCVEDERGARYWLYRAGSYKDGEPQWYLHGFFA